MDILHYDYELFEEEKTSIRNNRQEGTQKINLVNIEDGSTEINKLLQKSLELFFSWVLSGNILNSSVILLKSQSVFLSNDMSFIANGFI